MNDNEGGDVKLPRIRERAESMQRFASENGGSPVRRNTKGSIKRTKSPTKKV